MTARVYLAGPITGLSYNGATSWREYASQELTKHGIRGVSPMRAKEFLQGVTELTGVFSDYGHPLTGRKAVVSRDRMDVMTCDLVLMNLLGAERVSIGTMVEIGWADAFRKPIVLVTEGVENPHHHDFVYEIAGFKVQTLEDALAVVVGILR